MELRSFAILMFAFSGALLAYALLLGITKDPELIVRWHATSHRNGARYAVRIAKAVAIAALAPAASGVVALFAGGIPAGVTFVVGLVLCLWVDARLFG